MTEEPPPEGGTSKPNRHPNVARRICLKSFPGIGSMLAALVSLIADATGLCGAQQFTRRDQPRLTGVWRMGVGNILPPALRLES